MGDEAVEIEHPDLEFFTEDLVVVKVTFRYRYRYNKDWPPLQSETVIKEGCWSLEGEGNIRRRFMRFGKDCGYEEIDIDIALRFPSTTAASSIFHDFLSRCVSRHIIDPVNVSYELGRPNHHDESLSSMTVAQLKKLVWSLTCQSGSMREAWGERWVQDRLSRHRGPLATPTAWDERLCRDRRLLRRGEKAELIERLQVEADFRAVDRAIARCRDCGLPLRRYRERTIPLKVPGTCDGLHRIRRISRTPPNSNGKKVRVRSQRRILPAKGAHFNEENSA